jgi:phosphoribosylformimino-5-aminoimidazole carboxamide ribotide isomerase
MIIYPAIDIRGGKAVRLVEGDFNQETTFDADPVEAARRWETLGATWIHIVDLDGARDGWRQNGEVIERIREAVSARIQLGGGIRSLQDIRAARAIGVDRIVIGSAAISDPDLVALAIHELGDAVAVGLDARNGKLATDGWTEQTDVDAAELAERYGRLGLAHVIFTDIFRDGRLQGPNLEALATMIERFPDSVIASGGISSLSDVQRVREAGAAGAIIGSALYHRHISLPDAIAVANAAPTGAQS